MTRRPKDTSKNGRCFELAAKWVLEHGKGNPKIRYVEGVVINQIDGLPMCHAWIEIDEKVAIDIGANVALPVAKYYKDGKIEQFEDKTHKLTRSQLMKAMLEKGSYGGFYNAEDYD